MQGNFQICTSVTWRLTLQPALWKCSADSQEFYSWKRFSEEDLQPETNLEYLVSIFWYFSPKKEQLKF